MHAAAESEKHAAVAAKMSAQSQAQSQLAQHHEDVAKIRELLQVDADSYYFKLSMS